MPDRISTHQCSHCLGGLVFLKFKVAISVCPLYISSGTSYLAWSGSELSQQRRTDIPIMSALTSQLRDCQLALVLSDWHAGCSVREDG